MLQSAGESWFIGSFCEVCLSNWRTRRFPRWFLRCQGLPYFGLNSTTTAALLAEYRIVEIPAALRWAALVALGALARRDDSIIDCFLASQLSAAHNCPRVWTGLLSRLMDIPAADPKLSLRVLQRCASGLNLAAYSRLVLGSRMSQ